MEAPATPETITVDLPGHPHMVRVARSMANRAADLAGLGFDRVEDLGLAIDESATTLLDLAVDLAADTSLHTSLIGKARTVEFVMSVAASTDAWPPVDWQDSIGGMVLESVATAVVFESDDRSSSIRVSIAN